MTAATKAAAVASISVELRALEDLIPYDRNARQHPPEQIDQLMSSIRNFGWTTPILVDGDMIVAGHGRRLAALKLIALGEVIRLPNGGELPAGFVPVIDCAGWTEDQRRAYTLADNATALSSTWDDDLLKVELKFLEGEGFDLNLTGFNDAAIASLLAEPSPDGTDANDPAAHWQGMPEFDQKDKTAFRSIPVHFKDQAAVDAFAERIGQKITDKTRFVWFPEIEIETYADKRYVSAE